MPAQYRVDKAPRDLSLERVRAKSRMADLIKKRMEITSESPLRAMFSQQSLSSEQSAQSQRYLNSPKLDMFDTFGPEDKPHHRRSRTRYVESFHFSGK